MAECIMMVIRTLTPILFACLSYVSAKAEGPKNPIFYQLNVGTASLPFSGNVCLQLGSRIYTPRLPFFAAIENQCFYTVKKYNWPGIGTYRYMRNYNSIAMAIGFHLFPRRTLSVDVGARVYGCNFNGRLKSDNDLLKRHIVDYHYFDLHAGLYLYFNIRITNRYSAFINMQTITFQDGTYPIPGFGIAYNVYKNEQ